MMISLPSREKAHKILGGKNRGAKHGRALTIPQAVQIEQSVDQGRNLGDQQQETPMWRVQVFNNDIPETDSVGSSGPFELNDMLDLGSHLNDGVFLKMSLTYRGHGLIWLHVTPRRGPYSQRQLTRFEAFQKLLLHFFNSGEESSVDADCPKKPVGVIGGWRDSQRTHSLLTMDYDSFRKVCHVLSSHFFMDHSSLSQAIHSSIYDEKASVMLFKQTDSQGILGQAGATSEDLYQIGKSVRIDIVPLIAFSIHSTSFAA